MNELYNNEALIYYNYEVKVSYKNIEVTDDDSEEENKIKQNIYQQQFLKCLRLEDYDDPKVMRAVDEIYNFVKNNSSINEYCEKLKIKILMLSLMHNVKDKAPTEFMFLFAYDYFEAMHLCLKDIFTLGYVSDINNKKLLEELEKQ
jgi:hypothetical protein